MIDTSIIIDEYQSGKSLRKLALEYDLDILYIKKQLRDNNVHIRTRNEQNKFSPQNQRRFQINDNYFSAQSPNMVYLLGFLAADGCVYARNNCIKIGLSSVDKPFLEQINREIESTYYIHDYVTNKGFAVSELRFSSYQIKQDLALYNIVPKKTYSFTFPSNIEEKYIRDFIRGYFDGDGSISSAGQGIRWQVCSHTKDVLIHILDFFSTRGIPKINICQDRRNGSYYIQYSTNSTKKIFDILYYPDCFCLPRKYEKYKQLIMK